MFVFSWPNTTWFLLFLASLVSTAGWIDTTSGDVTSKIVDQSPFGRGKEIKVNTSENRLSWKKKKLLRLKRQRSRKQRVPVIPMKHRNTSGHETFSRRRERDWRPARQTNVAPSVKRLTNKLAALQTSCGKVKKTHWKHLESCEVQSL